MFSRLRESLEKRLFQINHVFLENYSILPVYAYHVILLVEFLQQLFFIFYQIDIHNDFKRPFTELKVNNSSVVPGNTTNSLLLSNETDQSSDITTLRVDQYLQVFNFPLFILQLAASTTTTQFKPLYATMNGAFLALVILCLSISDSLFKEATTPQTGGLKEGSRMIVKLLSFMMKLYLSVFQIPMYTILFQSFLCNEDPEAPYTSDVNCDEMTHYVYMGVSVVMLIMYLSFIYVQKQLYTQKRYDSIVPWASLRPKSNYVQTLTKLLLCLAFILNKQINLLVSGIIDLVCSLLCLSQLISKFKGSLMINNSVFSASLVYESLSMSLFLSLGIKKLTNYELTLVYLFIIVCLSILIALFIVNLYQRLTKQIIGMEKPLIKLNSPIQYIEYFFQMYKLITSSDPQDTQLMLGVFYNHVHQCQVFNRNDHNEQIDGRSKCRCQEIAFELQGNYSRRHRQQKKKYSSQSKQSILQGKRVELSTIKEGATSVALFTFNQIQQNKKGPPQSAQYVTDYSNTLITKSNPSPNTTQTTNTQSKSLVFKEEQNKESTGLENQSHEIPVSEILYMKSSLKQNSSDSPNKSNKRLNLNFGIQNIQSVFSDGTSAFTKSALVSDEISTNHKNKTKEQDSFWDHYKQIDYSDDESQIELLSNQNADSQKQVLMKAMFDFMAILIQQSIRDFPNNAELRILSAQLQQSMLRNEFNSIFDLLNCEAKCVPSFQDRFIIFRQKIQLEHSLIFKADRNYQRDSKGLLDVVKMYNYEKLTQKFAILEFNTANTASSFWREQLQANFNTSIIQKYGGEISSQYTKIQNIANQLMKINPIEIKFLYRYGLFLKSIVNNEYEAMACFEKACNIFSSSVQKINNDDQINNDEQTRFGPNSNSALVIIECTSQKVGTIIHCNQDFQRILGYQPKEIYQKNLSFIMPGPIGNLHNKFIQNYFRTIQSHVMNSNNAQFALSALGYLIPVQILIKVLPQLNDKIVIMGWIQELDKYGMMQPVKAEFENLDHQYIITDENGDIQGVTEGLKNDLGLNSKMFRSKGQLQCTLPLRSLIPDIDDPEYRDLMKNEGAVMLIDTSELLNIVELEQLSLEEIREIRNKLGAYQALVQMKRFKYHIQDAQAVYLYRISLAQLHSNAQGYGGGTLIQEFGPQTSIENIDFQGLPVPQNTGNHQSSNDDSELDMRSVSSTQSSLTNFNKMIKDFKKVLSERETPSSLKNLGRMIVVIMLVTISLSIVEFRYKSSAMYFIHEEGDHSLHTEIRYINFVQLTANMRSLINIANGIESNQYSGSKLYQVNRFNYLNQLISRQLQELIEIHYFLTTQRIDVNDQGQKQIDEQSTFEFKDIAVYDIDAQNRVYQSSQPYRKAMITFLNQISLKNKTLNDLKLPGSSLITGTIDPTQVFESTTLNQKQIVYILLNGLRSLRELTLESKLYQTGIAYQQTMDSVFLIVMCVGIAVSVLSIYIVLVQLWTIEKNKDDILSLYSLLKLEQIQKVYIQCATYIDLVYQQTPIKNATDCYSRSLVYNSESEEEKVDNEQKQLKSQRRKGKIQENSNSRMQEGMHKLIKQSINQVKEIQDRFEKERSQENRDYGGQQIYNNQKVKNDNNLNKKQKKLRNALQFKKQNEDLDESTSSNAEIDTSKVELQEQQYDPQIDIHKDSNKERSQRFTTDLKSRNWKFFILNSCIGLLIISYFIYSYWYHISEVTKLKSLKENTPLFFNRYSSLILSFAFMKERILNNNSVESYYSNTSLFSPHKIDDFYKTQSQEIENYFVNLKAHSQSIIEPMIDFTKVVDSDKFCSSIIGSDLVQDVVKIKSLRDKKMAELGRQVYQYEIDVIQNSIISTQMNNVETLKQLRKMGVDLNNVQYDHRTPLHVAATVGRLNAAKYLVEEAKVNLNLRDRWGATALDEALHFRNLRPEIYDYLLKAGAQFGEPTFTLKFLQNVTVTNQTYKLLYAAYHGDIQKLEYLRMAGWQVNAVDLPGRAALHVAASEGNLEAVRYLVEHGADISLKDNRGNDPLTEAIRENRTATVEYLNSVVAEKMSKNFCNDFEDGLLSKGIYQAFGVFHKRLADLQIAVNNENDYSQRLLFLKSDNNPTSSNINRQQQRRTIAMFTSTLEFYIDKIVKQLIEVSAYTQNRFTEKYTLVTLIMFIVFLLFQVLIILYLRGKLIRLMSEDVFQSRGILNLIPEEFLEENRETVEKIMRKLKN